MFIVPVALGVLTFGQQVAEIPMPERPVLKAGLGACSAEFRVRDADGSPSFGATIHVRVRYGVLGIKRTDLEVGTDSNGHARIEGLPAKAKPLAYDIQKDGKKATAEQIVADMCQAKYDVTLK